MATQDIFTIAGLARRIQICASEKFTGQLSLEINNLKGQRWNLYFRLGSLIWGTSEIHPMRRCYRQLSQHCPQLTINSVQPQYWDYNYLAELVRQEKIQRKQMTAVVRSSIAEILFDILQWGERRPLGSSFQLNSNPIPRNTTDLSDSILVSLRVEELWQLAVQDWEAWRQANLVNYSPNQAPIILKAQELQRQTPLLAYHNLITLADGSRTLRDLAAKLKQNLLLLTQSLTPSIRQGLIGLIEVDDFTTSMQSVKATNVQTSIATSVQSVRATNVQTPIATDVSPSQPQQSSSLVAYIDDSRNDSVTMSHILAKAGYRFLNIEDPVKALPMLLEHKPDLIFLDLVMPIANGYEICAQIRRISVFKDTPVIILTSNDGIVDRVRAKMVGSSGFLAKPIDSEKVLAILQWYLPISTTIPTQRLQKMRVWSSQQ